MTNRPLRSVVSIGSVLALVVVSAVAVLGLLSETVTGMTSAQPGTGVIRVATTGSDTPGCGSQANPCRTMQYAVDQAETGDEIRVAAGNYTGVHGRAAPAGYDGPAIITQVVYISKAVTLRGGYTAAFTDPPDPAANPTILDAQGGGRVLYITGDISPYIEGLNITGGDATGLGGGLWGEDGGGGLYARLTTAIISGNIVYGNTAYRGGGVYLKDSATTLLGNSIVSNTAGWAAGGLGVDSGTDIIRNNAILSNHTLYAGGIGLHNDSATLSGNSVNANTATDGAGLYLSDSEATLSSNSILANRASQWGGGLYLSGSDASLDHNTVASNTAELGGGLYLHFDSPAALTANTITSNTATWGGGIYVGSAARLEGNTISDNSADISGGGLSLGDSSATLYKNMIIANTAPYGGGVVLNSSDAATLDSNTFMHNVADIGGGLYLFSSDATLNDNTVVSNTAQQRGGGLYLGESAAHFINNIILSNSAGHRGGGLALIQSDATLINTVIADNQSSTLGSGMDVEDASPRLLHTTFARNGSANAIYVAKYAGSSDVILTNTIIADHAWGITVMAGNTATLNATLWHANGTDYGGSVIHTGDYAGDPRFATDGYHLMDGSAAIDKGVVTAARATLDIDGDARPQGAGYDLGADEFRYWRLYLPLITRSH